MTRWLICDEGICLYNADLADRRGMERCIKHGAILGGAHQLKGLSRKEARKLLNHEAAKAEREMMPESKGYGYRP